MASALLVPVEEYLRSAEKPVPDYIDGMLRPRSMPTYKHGKMQFRVGLLINRLGMGFEAIPEQTVQLREGKYLVPDVAVQRLSELQQPYPTRPVHLCVEVLSPDDRFSDTVAKCEDYHAWGVPFCWIIDPEKKRAWEYRPLDRPHEVGPGGQMQAGEISLTFGDLFAGF